MARSLKRIKGVSILSLHLDKNRYDEIVIRCQTIGDRSYCFSERVAMFRAIAGAPVITLTPMTYRGKIGLGSRYSAKEHKFALDRPSKRFMSGKVVITHEDSDA